jgi:hypothetical protein
MTVKKKRHGQWIKQIYRDIGYPLAVLFKNTPVTPNSVTLSRLVFMGIAGWLIHEDTYIAHVVAAFCIFLFSMLDAMDGCLATVQDKRSKLGVWLDPQVDAIGFIMMFSAIAFYLERFGPYWNYITMYTLWIFFFRGWLMPIMLKDMDKFADFRDEQPQMSSLETTKEALAERKQSIFGMIREQTVPHTHNVALYMILGLLTGQLQWFVAFVALYLTAWYSWTNIRLVLKAMRIDRAARDAAS